MFGWLKTRNDLQRRAIALHEASVDDARAPHLYANLRVPDTTDGRLEMLALHVVLLIDRLGRAGPNAAAGVDGPALAQAVTEVYVIAMDDAMRAIGVGDLAVPRKVKKAAAALYDRHQAYRPALAAVAGGQVADQAWHDALATVFAPIVGGTEVDLRALAHYAAMRALSLASLPDAPLLEGRLTA